MDVIKDIMDSADASFLILCLVGLGAFGYLIYQLLFSKD
jgi:hypothetical protein